MGEAFIVRRGGMPAFAAIGVSYPSGSVCTCTKGTRVLRAKDTSGEYLFLIPEAGMWIVSCTDGERIETKSVDIDTRYQIENIALSYRIYLFNNGEEYSSITGGWEVYNRTGGRSAKEGNRLKIAAILSGSQRDGSVFTVNTIQRGEKTTLKALVDVVDISPDSSGIKLGLAAAADAVPTWSFSVVSKTTGEQTLSLDITEYTGSNLYVGLNAHALEAYCYSVWLE